MVAASEEEKARALEEVTREITAMLLRKSRDYGSENIRLTGGELGLTVRVIDKAMRLHNLNLRGVIEGGGSAIREPATEETLEDTWKDLVGYGLIALVCRRGVKW